MFYQDPIIRRSKIHLVYNTSPPPESVEISDIRDESLIFVTYMMFDTLESLFAKTQLHFKFESNKWEHLNFYRLSTENKDLSLYFNNISDNFAADLNIMHPTEPGPFLFMWSKVLICLCNQNDLQVLLLHLRLSLVYCRVTQQYKVLNLVGKIQVHI